MNNHDDPKWQGLLARSAPTFTADPAPPYGFITATIARLREERQQQDELERIGWRALLASVAALLVVAAVTWGMNPGGQNDLDPGVRSLVQMENIQVS